MMKNLLKYTSLFLLLFSQTCIVLVSCEKANDSSEDISATRGKYNGHDWVDLGLSVKWSSCNVGATYPYEYGNYYAWGEVTGYDEGKKEFSKSTYKWYEEGVGYTKYGKAHNKYLLDAEDDAAKVNWGGNWRIPHPSEVAELMNGCYWEWTNDYNGSGVKGVIVYKAKATTDRGIYCDASKSIMPSVKYDLNDTHIFLPAAGSYCPNYSSGGGGAGGQYLTSAIGSDDSGQKNNTYYSIGGQTDALLQYGFDNDERAIGDYRIEYGYSVRAVCP
jgi:hypothetical protein